MSRETADGDMTCQDFLDDIDLSALQTLEAGEDARLRAHAGVCEPCREHLLSAEAMAARLGMTVPVVTAPRAMRSAVMQAVRGATASSPSEVAARAAGSRWPALLRWRPARLGTIAAGLLVVPLAGSLLWNARLQQQVDDLRQLRQQVGELEQETAHIRQQNDGLLLFSVPSAIKADFQPVTENVAARGAASWSPDRNKCYVRFDSLPPPSEGQVYRLWYVVDNNRVVDAGVLSPDEDGRADATIDTSRWRGKAYEMVLRLEQRPSDAEAKALLTAILSRPQ